MKDAGLDEQDRAALRSGDQAMVFSRLSDRDPPVSEETTGQRPVAGEPFEAEPTKEAAMPWANIPVVYHPMISAFGPSSNWHYATPVAGPESNWGYAAAPGSPGSNWGHVAEAMPGSNWGHVAAAMPGSNWGHVAAMPGGNWGYVAPAVPAYWGHPPAVIHVVPVAIPVPQPPPPAGEPGGAGQTEPETTGEDQAAAS